MVDMFTLVLLFLLVFYDPSYQTDGDMQLPNATIDRTVEKGPIVKVTATAVLVSTTDICIPSMIYRSIFGPPRARSPHRG